MPTILERRHIHEKPKIRYVSLEDRELVRCDACGERNATIEIRTDTDEGRLIFACCDRCQRSASATLYLWADLFANHLAGT